MDQSKLLNDVLEHIGQGVVMFDGSRRLAIWNSKYEKILKFPDGFLLPGMPILDLGNYLAERGDYGPGDPRELAQNRANLLWRDEGERTEITVQGGTFFEILVQKTNDNGLVISYTDATERKNTEAARKEIESRFQSVVENSPTSIHLKDLDGRFQFVNKCFQDWYGFTAEEAVGRTSRDLFPSEFSDDFIKQDEEILNAGVVAERELRVRFADGEIHSIYNIKFPVADDDGHIVGIGTIATNLTEFNALEEKLRHSQRLDAIGQLTGGIAHDFNNLLNVMIGNAELLEGEIHHNDKTQSRLDAIKEAVRRASSLTNRLLVFSRQQTLEPVVSDVSGLIGGLADMLQRTLGETVDFKRETGPDLWPTMVDPHQFENAIVNLSINARDAMPKGGLLTIQTRNSILTEDDANKNEEVIPGDYIHVSISDTGTGMPPEVLAKVYDPYFTTKDVGKGSGLGLSMVYGFMQQSKGHIDISSKVGCGSTINLYFPRARDAVIPEFTETAAPELARGSARILVVEDDENVRLVPVTILRDQGYEVVEASDGQEATDRLAENGPFDLLFTDIILPGGMNGLEIAEYAKRAQPGIKILFTTGYVELGVLNNAALAKSASILKKPYGLAELLTKVQATLNDETLSE
jgi:PAS domain S-box-containing protein